MLKFLLRSPEATSVSMARVTFFFLGLSVMPAPLTFKKSGQAKDQASYEIKYTDHRKRHQHMKCEKATQHYNTHNKCIFLGSVN